MFCHVKKTQVRDLMKLYYEIEVPSERLLFKIPSTWQVRDTCHSFPISPSL